jgi:YfiH family protein
MIRPPGSPGAAFSLAVEGDQRDDPEARHRLSTALGIESGWAEVGQVHGAVVLEVSAGGKAGEADAMFTRRAGLPLAVFTADCLAVVVGGDHGVGVAHAGWRGMQAGVVGRLLEEMSTAGLAPQRAWLGPAIGPCCFEVGEEVASLFPGAASTTTWGTTSVDLVAAARLQLAGVEVWSSDHCTRHHDDTFSHRRTGSPSRMAGLAWWEGEG